jgi:hypothetical protein
MKATDHVGHFFGQVIVVAQCIVFVSVAGIQVGWQFLARVMKLENLVAVECIPDQATGFCAERVQKTDRPRPEFPPRDNHLEKVLTLERSSLTPSPDGMPTFTAREIETQSLLEHVRRQCSVLVLGRGGVGKSALLEQAAGILEVETLVVNLERVAPFANFLRDLFNKLWTARALDACTFLPENALYSDIEESHKLWMKFHPNNDLRARSLTDSLEKYAIRESRAVIVMDDLTGISPTIVPWVVELEQVCTLVCAAPFEEFQKPERHAQRPVRVPNGPCQR